MNQTRDLYSIDKKKRILLVTLIFAIASLIGLFHKCSRYLYFFLCTHYQYTPFDMSYFSFIGSIIGVFIIQKFGLKIVTFVSLTVFAVTVTLYGILWNTYWFSITEFLMQISFALARCVVYIVPCVLFNGSYAALYMCALHLFYNIGVFFGEPLIHYFETSEFMGHYDAFLIFTILACLLLVAVYFTDFNTINVIRSECTNYRFTKVIREPIIYVFGSLMAVIFIINGYSIDYCMNYITTYSSFDINTWSMVSDIIACVSLLVFGAFADKINQFKLMYSIFLTVIISAILSLFFSSLSPYFMFFMSLTVYLCLPLFLTCIMAIYGTDSNVPLSVIYVIGEFFYNLLNELVNYLMHHAQLSIIVLFVLSCLGFLLVYIVFKIHKRNNVTLDDELFSSLQFASL